MKKSIWSDNVDMPEFASMTGNKKTDVLIIGGGMCGILCAHFLNNAGIDYILVEGSRIASGITEDTTAKITLLHGLIYNKLIKSAGTEKAKMYLTANQKAIDEYEKIFSAILYDFEKKSAYTYSLDDREKIEDEIKALDTLGFNAVFTSKTELPFKVAGAVRADNQAQFNPLKFISGVSKGLNIYENTFVREMKGNTAVTDNGNITAGKIIVATHFPFINKHGSYFLKMYQHRSYVTAFENVIPINGMYIDESETGMSFKSYGKYLLIGGGGHRTGKKGGAWEELQDFAKKYYPLSRPKYSWATQDCITLDKVPYIGLYSKNTPNMYTATGFNKWGMTSSMAAAMILCDMVTGKKNEFSEVFSPQRSMLKPQLLINGFEAAVNLLTPSSKRCPHLGCALKWNKAEHSWDCPCHGSRFDKDGHLLNNPANGNINTK